MTELQEKALALAAKGYAVIPLRGKLPTRGMKGWPDRARAGTGKKAAKCIRVMPWGEADGYGIATDKSGLVVVDLDYDEDKGHDGRADWARLCETNNPGKPGKAHGGAHLFYRAHPRRPTQTTARRVAPGIDIRAKKNGYVVAYEDASHLPEVKDLPGVPLWVLKANEKPPGVNEVPEGAPRPARFPEGEGGSPWGLSGLKSELQRLRDSWDANDGEFNDTLNRVAGKAASRVAGGELDADHAYAELSGLLTELGASDQQKTLDSGWCYGIKRPVSSDDRQATVDESTGRVPLRDLMVRYSPDLGTELPQWLVKGWLEKDSLSRIYGAPKTFKSFVAVDLACRVASGTDAWHGYPIRRHGPVMYLAAEGGRGVERRIRAWARRHGVEPKDIRVLPVPVGTTTGQWDELVELVAELRPVLIVIDTQAKVTAGADENSNPEMGTAFRQFGRLRIASGACVLLVHHSGHAATGRARGASSMFAELDTEIQCTRLDEHGRALELTLKKQKDDEDGLKLSLALETQGLGFDDEDGKPVTSLVTTRTEGAAGLAVIAGQDKVKRIAAAADEASLPLHGRVNLEKALEDQFPGAHPRDWQAAADLRKKRQRKTA